MGRSEPLVCSLVCDIRSTPLPGRGLGSLGSVCGALAPALLRARLFREYLVMNPFVGLGRLFLYGVHGLAV
jgi:hypothetical protein